MTRWAWAEIDPTAIEHNVRLLRAAAPGADLWAVVKAGGYGHGAMTAAQAALRAGAGGLFVALVEEGVALRRAGITAPIMLLTQQPPEQAAEIVEHGLVATVHGVDGALALVGAGATDHPVHLKVDTGMGRVGAATEDAVTIAAAIADLAPAVRLEGVFTHMACADDPASPATALQLGRFDEVLAALTTAGLRPPVAHAANSAAVLAVASSHHDRVRTGIAIYGISPGPGVDHLTTGLRPALSLHARVSMVKPVRAGSPVSYGWRHTCPADTIVATVPIGYADGVPRRLGTMPDRAGADVLIGGRRCPVVGVVTMDQLMVDVGHLDRCAPGDEVVLIGEQGGERILVDEWARRLGTIGYEVVCAISARVPRVLVAGGRATS